MKNFYDIPTQVMYWDGDEERYIGGIAYHDEVICATDGCVMEILDLIESVKDSRYNRFDAIYEYGNWEDFTAQLCGGVLPDGCPSGRIE